MKTFYTLSVGVVALFLATSTVSAQIIWAAAQAISSDTDVSTAGIYVDAIQLGTAASGDKTSNETVNGVNFLKPTTTASVGHADPGDAIISLSNLDSFANGYTPTGPGTTAAYTDILNGSGGNNHTSVGTITLNDLTVGKEYQIELWSVGNSDTVLKVGGVTSTTLNGNLYDIGTFTASSTSFSFTAQSGNGAYFFIGDISLRELPEPPVRAMLLGGLGLLAFGLRFSRNRSTPAV